MHVSYSLRVLDKRAGLARVGIFFDDFSGAGQNEGRNRVIRKKLKPLILRSSYRKDSGAFIFADSADMVEDGVEKE